MSSPLPIRVPFFQDGQACVIEARTVGTDGLCVCLTFEHDDSRSFLTPQQALDFAGALSLVAHRVTAARKTLDGG